MKTLTHTAVKPTFGTLVALALLAGIPMAQAKVHPATETCRTPVSDFHHKGKPLTYEQVTRSSGATKIASTEAVYATFLLPNGREAIYEVTPEGCARKTNLGRTLR